MEPFCSGWSEIRLFSAVPRSASRGPPCNVPGCSFSWKDIFYPRSASVLPFETCIMFIWKKQKNKKPQRVKYQFHYVENIEYSWGLKHHYLFFTSFRSSKEFYTPYCLSSQAVASLIKIIQFGGRLLWEHIYVNHVTLLKDPENSTAAIHNRTSHSLHLPIPCRLFGLRSQRSPTILEKLQVATASDERKEWGSLRRTHCARSPSASLGSSWGWSACGQPRK